MSLSPSSETSNNVDRGRNEQKGGQIEQVKHCLGGWVQECMICVRAVPLGSWRGLYSVAVGVNGR